MCVPIRPDTNSTLEVRDNKTKNILSLENNAYYSTQSFRNCHGDIEKHERFSSWFCTSGNIYL